MVHMIMFQVSKKRDVISTGVTKGVLIQKSTLYMWREESQEDRLSPSRPA